MCSLTSLRPSILVCDPCKFLEIYKSMLNGTAEIYPKTLDTLAPEPSEINGYRDPWKCFFLRNKSCNSDNVIYVCHDALRTIHCGTGMELLWCDVIVMSAAIFRLQHVVNHAFLFCSCFKASSFQVYWSLHTVSIPRLVKFPLSKRKPLLSFIPAVCAYKVFMPEDIEIHSGVGAYLSPCFGLRWCDRK